MEEEAKTKPRYSLRDILLKGVKGRTAQVPILTTLRSPSDLLLWTHGSKIYAIMRRLISLKPIYQNKLEIRKTFNTVRNGDASNWSCLVLCPDQLFAHRMMVVRENEG
jgi:hypothetical protein